MPINVRGSEISIRFAYNPAVVDLVRTIPGRSWNPTTKAWEVPATSWHARKVIEVLSDDLQVGNDVRMLAGIDQKDWNHSTLNISVGSLLLRPYQAGAVEFLDSIGGRGIIADDVGTGKTAEAISYARFIGDRSFLVVAPASVLYKWEREIKAWYPEVADSVMVISSGSTKIEGTVHIISYDMLRRRFHDLLGIGYRIMFLDECHHIRNYKTQQFKAAREVANRVPKLIGMSGTPIINRPIELYNILNLLDSRTWTWYGYANRYCGWHQRGDSAKGAENLGELEERLRGVMIRRFKQDVADQIPSLTRTVVPLHLNDQAMRTYRLLEREDPATIKQLFPESKGYFYNHLDWIAAMRQFLERARAQHVAAWAEDFLDASDDKLIIYCGYKSTVRSLNEHLERWGVEEITGDVSNVRRQQIIDRWQNTRHERVMLLTSAGGEGIDLFGKAGINCSTVLFAGREWTPATEEQIEGRLHRTGQLYPVESVYLVAQDTIDEMIHGLIESKRAVIREAVGSAVIETNIVSDLVEAMRRVGIVKKEIKKTSTSAKSN